MTKMELEGYRQSLLVLGKRLGGDISGVAREALRRSGGEASGSLSNAPLHLADLGTDNFEQELAVSLVENSVQTLDQIAAALGRIDEGTYGRCQECGRQIPAKRLQALPYTPHCVDCARRIQAEEAEWQGPQGL
jgi:RNA polymerase-binding transcription factor DksA